MIKPVLLLLLANACNRALGQDTDFSKTLKKAGDTVMNYYHQDTARLPSILTQSKSLISGKKQQIKGEADSFKKTNIKERAIGLTGIRGVASGLKKLKEDSLKSPKGDSLKNARVDLKAGIGIKDVKAMFEDTALQRALGINLDSIIPQKPHLSVEDLSRQQIKTIEKNIYGLKSSFGLPQKPQIDLPKKSKFIKPTFAEISDIINVTPLILLDSSSMMAQNNLQGNFSFVLQEKYGFTGYVSYRKTITGPLPDFFDFHIGYSGKVPSVNKVSSPVSKESLQKAFLKDNVFDSLINKYKEDIDKLKSLSNSSLLEGKVISAKETVANYNADTSSVLVDSSNLARAKEILAWYDKFQKKIAALQQISDSIEFCKSKFLSLLNGTTRISELKSLFPEVDSIQNGQIGNAVNAAKNKKLNTNLKPESGLSRFSLGRLFPYQSELTLKNNSLKGIDVGYHIGHFNFSATAGLIDFQLNGLIQKRKIEKPIPYAVVLYAGYKPRAHFTAGLRYFAGKKDNYGGGINKPLIQGLAAELIYNRKNNILTLELAKNIGQPVYTKDTIPLKSFGDFKDMENMALSVKTFFFITYTATNVEASFTAQGKYFNAFNTFSVNTQTKKYDIKISQGFWKGALRLTAGLRNTEYTPALNGIILQSEVDLKSLNVSFNKNRWPVINIGYNPVKQVFVNDSAVQVSIYQALSLFGSYGYKLGIRKANVSLMISRLANKPAAGAVPNYLGNSLSMVFDHDIDFQAFSSLINISYTNAPDFLFVTAGSGIIVNVIKNASLKGGMSINSFNHVASKIGGNLGFQVGLGSRGSLGIDYIRSFMPSTSGKTLSDYNYGNLNFRYNLIR